MKTGSIMRPALMANVAVGYSQGERIQIMTAAAATHRSGARKPEKISTFKKSDASTFQDVGADVARGINGYEDSKFLRNANRRRTSLRTRSV